MRGRPSQGQPRRAAISAILLAAAIGLPFLAWSPPDFWRGLVRIQLTSPFRPDALSVLSLVARRTGVELPSAVGFVAAALVAALAILRGAGPGRAAVGGAAVFLAFCAFNKQAFFNYYWIVGVLLLLATVSEIARWASEAPFAPGRSTALASEDSAGGSG